MTPYRSAPRHARVLTLVPPPASFKRRLSAWWRGVFKRLAVHALLREYTLMLRAFDRDEYHEWAHRRERLFWSGDKYDAKAWHEFQRVRFDRLKRGVYDAPMRVAP